MAHSVRELLGPPDPDSLDNRDPELVRRTARALRRPLWRWFSPEVRGLARIPAGAALYVGNHSGGFVAPDMWIFAVAVLAERGIEDVPYGLAHEVLMRAPAVSPILSRMGGLVAKPENARRALARGLKVLVYPGGDLDAFRPWHEAHRVVFGPRRGYVRLALRDSVPIVPVVAAGGHAGWRVLSDGRWLAERLRTHRFLRTDVLPITLSLPWGIAVGAPPYLPWPTKVLIEVLEPIVFDRRGEDAAGDDDYVEICHRRVVTEMQGTLDRLARELRARRPPRLRDRLRRRRG